MRVITTVITSRIFKLFFEQLIEYSLSFTLNISIMENMRSDNVKKHIYTNNEGEIITLLESGLDPNFEGGWPIRLAARYGCYSIVNTFMHYGANPHLLGDSGASTLQLAVYSGEHWDTENWTDLLSCCDSSQIADGAAVAIIFNNIAALKKLMETGRCNTHLPTTLTGKTVEQLAKGYKLSYILNTSTIYPTIISTTETPATLTPRVSRNRINVRSNLSPNHQPPHRNLSPSVARFFHQTAGQSALTPPRSPTTLLSSPYNC